MTNSNLPRKKLNKSDCSYDPLVPAIAADCVHVPHIGELNRLYRELLKITGFDIKEEDIPFSEEGEEEEYRNNLTEEDERKEEEYWKEVHIKFKKIWIKYKDIGGLLWDYGETGMIIFSGKWPIDS